MIDRLDEQLDDGTVVIADVGDSLFGATELTTHGKTEFISPAYYTSMGFAVPAALGVHVARPDARVVAIVGDGAFQMTGMEFSNLVRYKFPTVVIVLDNGGYGTERLLHPGDWKFNDIPPWQYHRAARTRRRRQRLPHSHGRRVSTKRLKPRGKSEAEPSILQVSDRKRDCSRLA